MGGGTCGATVSSAISSGSAADFSSSQNIVEASHNNATPKTIFSVKVFITIPIT